MSLWSRLTGATRRAREDALITALTQVVTAQNAMFQAFMASYAIESPPVRREFDDVADMERYLADHYSTPKALAGLTQFEQLEKLLLHLEDD